jgi:hypothetical protein
MAVPRRNALLLYVLLLIVGLQRGESQERTENNPTVLKGATVIDGLGNTAIPDAVILIEKDRIKSLGSKGTTYPNNANVVDLSGKFIIPGLVDSHVHYQPWLGELFLNYGVTSIMWQGGDSPNDDRQVSYQANVRTPRIFATGGRPPLQPAMTREQVRTAVREWVNNKRPDYSNPPVYNHELAQVFQWAAEDLHQAGIVWFGHTEDAPASIKAGEDVIEHLWGFAEPLMSPGELEGFQKGQYLHWGLFLKDQRRVDQEIKEAVSKGTYLNPTLVYELGGQSSLASSFQEEIRTLFRDESLQTYFPKNLWEGAVYKLQAARNFSRRYENLAAFSALPPAEKKKFDEAYKLCREFLKKWVAAGGKVIAGTDDPSAGLAGITLHMEMAMLVESGLTPMQALQAATGWGSTALLANKKGVVTRPPVGIIAEGVYADLVVLSANPLTNIANTRKIERVMKGGQFIKLGYTPNYGTPRNPVAVIPHTPDPEISAISATGNELVVNGVGFIGSSTVRINDVPAPTTFVDIRTLRVKMPSSGAKNVKVTVFNKPPDGGFSDAVILKGSDGIRAIVPYKVVEGSPAFDLVVSGSGFTPNSVVRASDRQLATTFVDAQTLRAKVPADLVSRALPNRFNAPGPAQNNGVYGDRTVKIGVDGLNSLSLRVVAKWLADEKE